MNQKPTTQYKGQHGGKALKGGAAKKKGNTSMASMAKARIGSVPGTTKGPYLSNGIMD